MAASGHARAAIRFTAFSVVVSLLCIIIGCVADILDPTRMKYTSSDSGFSTAVPTVVVVIDPGHGGEDGGASGTNGVYEKTLNLAIAKILCSQLLAGGIPAVLTREEDKMLYDKYGELSDYSRHKKTYDLRNRLRMTEEYEEPVFVSIHMNSFSISKYNGLQVFIRQMTNHQKYLLIWCRVQCETIFSRITTAKQSERTAQYICLTGSHVLQSLSSADLYLIKRSAKNFVTSYISLSLLPQYMWQ